MRNFIFLRMLLACFLLGCTFKLNAQVVTEHSQIPPGSPEQFHSINDMQQYSKVVDDPGRKMYILNSPGQNYGTLGTNSNVTLTFNLVCDPIQFIAPNIVHIYNDNGYSDYAFNMGSGTIAIDLQPGTYDIAAQFIDGLPWEPPVKYHFVIKELVDVLEDTEITIDVAEADNHVTAQVLNETGEILEPGIYDAPSESIIGGNAQISFKNIVMFDPSDRSVFDNSFVWGMKATADAEPLWNYYINDLSDRYKVIQNVTAVGYDGKNYFSKFETLNGISESINREIDPESWLLHHDIFQASPLGESADISYKSFIAVYTWEGNKLGGWTSVNDENMSEEGVAVYLNNPLDGDPADLLVFPAIADHIAMLNPMMGEEGFFIAGNAVVKGAGGNVMYGSGNTCPNWFFLSDDFYRTNEGGWKILPFNQQFTYTNDSNTQMIQGDNTPVSVVGTVTRPDILYKGRFGEKRESDMFSSNIEVKQNGEVVFSGGAIEYKDLAFPETGDIEVTFTNANVMVDGLTGTNTTVVTYNATEGDNAPTVQMLQLRDASGKVTDRFDFAAEGAVRLAAGDFQYNWDTAVYDYNEGNTVELFYSLHNGNDWSSLELTEYPEHFFLPAFGNYYEASLEGVEVPAENSWFDLRIVCTDSNGNKQDQIVSPAFKINSVLSIENANALNGLLVYPNPLSGELQVQLPENIAGDYTFEIIDLAGKILHSEVRTAGSERLFSWDSSSLSTGVYLLSITSGEQYLAKKIIKE